MKWRLRKKLSRRLGCKTFHQYRIRLYQFHDAFTKALEKIDNTPMPDDVDEQNFSIMFNYDYEKEEYVPVVKCTNGFTMEYDE